MIGAVRHSKAHVTLSSLEEIWCSHHSDPTALLTALQPSVLKILVKKEQCLFLDMMKFVAMVVADLYDRMEGGVLEGFVERFLSAAHLTANKYYSSHTFDQNRYLDCVAALLAVWTDCTDRVNLIIPKYTVYCRGSTSHLLDTILQSLNIGDTIKSQLLNHVKDISTVDLFVKYTIVGRGFPIHKIEAMSKQPSEDIFRCWLLKHNITNVRSVCEFLNNNRADQDLLSAMCSPFYTLPSVSGEDTNEPEPEIDSTTMFFIDRGVPSKPVESAPVEDMSTESSPQAPLAPRENLISEESQVSEMPPPTVDSSEPLIETVEQSSTVEVLLTEEQARQEPPIEPIKIKNLRKRKSKSATPAREMVVGRAVKSVVKEPDENVALETVEPIIVPITAEPEIANLSPVLAGKENQSANIAPLTQEKLESLPSEKASVRRSTHRRRNSNESAGSVGSMTSVTSVESVASRTRGGRGRAALAPESELLAAITEESVTETVASDLSTKLKTKASELKKARTPVVKFTPKSEKSTVKKGRARNISETIDETPQIPVRKTRSRKLDV